MNDMQDKQATDETQATHGTYVAHDAQVESGAAEPEDIAPPLVALLASIRAAVLPDASVEARAAGVTACRSVVAVLQAKAGEPLAAASPPSASPAATLVGMLKQPGLLSKLAAMSRDQLIDLLKQVTGAQPTLPPPPATAGPRFHLIQIPLIRRPGGT